MHCPKCQFENREGVAFCEECGAKLELECPSCLAKIPLGRKFCGKCGHNLEPAKHPSAETSKPETPFPESPIERSSFDATPIIGERKHVTVLFSDLTGYTAMAEQLDPEEVKDITTQMFNEISKIIGNYDGFIEKFAGDAVMALFGAKKAHEDDPIRAIKAARAIHNIVHSMSPKYEALIGQPLSMHTGINTGLVVTGDINLERGTHGVAGDVLNVAARLSGMGKADEILVGQNTYRQAEGYFEFTALDSTVIKGKSEPIQIYKVLSLKEKPVKIHRLHGLRADLVGRKVEFGQIIDSVQKLSKDKKGSVVSICGAAGTGKSRLIEELRLNLNLEKMQWLEGHAYPHSQNIPYYPLIDLLNKTLQIEENDPPRKVKEKVETGISSLIGEEINLIPYIGSLFSISYPEIEEVSPEFWKSQLKKAVETALQSLAQRSPTIICLEDLQWADPSFLELIRLILADNREPLLFLCAYRPIVSIFSSHQIAAMADIYKEIRLHDLSASESQSMVESLLKSTSIPSDLQRFVRDKVEGNPFYIEEVINSLIETETLVKDNGGWKLTRPISEVDISASIHGVISGRIDRLEAETKRILQEASVIGKAFLYDILQRITGLKKDIDICLSGLERLDLIKTRSLQPDLEYIFKHALTQEVVYSGLLKKERQSIHERIGLVMEQLFQDRLPEFYETLAFHFKQSRSIEKAAEYLTKAGDKSLRRYAVEESHQYFKDAFDVISDKPEKTKDEEKRIIDILLKWAYVFNHRGDFRGLADLFCAHEALAESLDDTESLGMFYAWLGWALNGREELKGAHKYLSKALKLGEEINNHKVIGYACAWLTWSCAALGLLDEAIVYAKRAQEMLGFFKSDKELFRFTIVGMGMAHWFRGECAKAIEAGKTLLEHGQKESDLRCMTMGHWTIGHGHYAAGNFASAIECHKRAIMAAPDPLFASSAKLLLGMTYIADGQLKKSENMFDEIMQYSEDLGAEIVGSAGRFFHGIITIIKGNLYQGVRNVEDLLKLWHENGSRYRYVIGNYMLGRLYLQIVEGKERRSLSFLAKNIGFLLKNVPFADKKAEAHFKIAIAVAKEIGANGLLGQAKLELGMLHKAKNRTDRARECISSAIQLFEACEAEVYLQQAREAKASLG
ncbi:MAG: adenylate/guanylate cyclase domain-containing protein [Desulfobacterales bacterium]